jgi:hypothetical protein
LNHYELEISRSNIRCSLNPDVNGVVFKYSVAMHIECTSPSFPQLITQNTSQTCQSLQNKDGDVCQCPQCHWIGREDDPPRLPNGVEK